MNGFLLDTNALSALRRPADNQTFMSFVEVQPDHVLHTSTVSIAEIRFGIELVSDAMRRSMLSDWLEFNVLPFFDGRVHDVTVEVLLRWLLISREGQTSGHTFPQQDSLIAAVAATNKLVVVTRDERHFVAAKVATLDPWSSTFHDAAGATHIIENMISPTLLNELPA